MIGLDTNVILRYIMQDDPVQARQATALIESLTADEPGFIPLIVLVEMVWVLFSAYRLNRHQVAQVLEQLAQLKEIRLDSTDLVLKALRIFKAGTADFSDCLIERIAANQGCQKTVTFDIAAAKSAGMVLLSA
ncbi:MAG: type II toxin-antitoxin system VapC family toxin [Pseudomonadota bacterium]|mgnify:FL=1